MNLNKSHEYIDDLKKELNTELMLPIAYEAFINFFRVHWWNGVKIVAPNAGDDISRSNLTYVTSHAFFSTCRDMNASCKFEAEGKHDAIVANGNGIVFMCAEWEWDSKSVFGDTGELKKLLRSVEKHKESDAILLTYTYQDEYLDYAKRVANEWLSSKTDAILLLFIVVMQKSNSKNTIEAIRILEISTEGCVIWGDF